MLKRILVTAFLGGALVLTGPAPLANADGKNHRHHGRDRHGHSYQKGYDRGYRHGYHDGSYDNYDSNRYYYNSNNNYYYNNYYYGGSYGRGRSDCRRCGGGALLDLNLNLDVL
ncbi:MAG: hypothetical protein AB1679_32255 [Actinomycetota bacterium]